MRKILVTGSCGLIGSEVCRFFGAEEFAVHGVDDNHRAVFFGPEGDTSWALEGLRRDIPDQHSPLDIRDHDGAGARGGTTPDVVVHCAAQPSHDRAAAIPFLDFETNAVGRSTCWRPPAVRVLNRRLSSCRRTKFTAMRQTRLTGARRRCASSILIPPLSTGYPRTSPSIRANTRCSVR